MQRTRPFWLCIKISYTIISSMWYTQKTLYIITCSTYLLLSRSKVRVLRSFLLLWTSLFSDTIILWYIQRFSLTSGTPIHYWICRNSDIHAKMQVINNLWYASEEKLIRVISLMMLILIGFLQSPFFNKLRKAHTSCLQKRTSFSVLV